MVEFHLEGSVTNKANPYSVKSFSLIRPQGHFSIVVAMCMVLSVCLSVQSRIIIVITTGFIKLSIFNVFQEQNILGCLFMH